MTKMFYLLKRLKHFPGILPTGPDRNRSSRSVIGLSFFVTMFMLLAPVNADQNDSALPQLYADLKQAPDPDYAANLESRIWQIWLDAPGDRATELLMATTSAMQQGDLREALIASTQLTNEFPDYAEGWNKRATLFYMMGNFDKSVADIYETLRREPKHFGAISGLGLIFQRKGDLAGALVAFEQVLDITPQSINARINVEQIKQALEKTDDI